jgi:hypothetical protein
MPAGAASRYALGAGVAWALRACAASLISGLALRARRSVHGAARLCARRRSRWLPSPPRATRSAPRWRAAPGHLYGSPRSAVAASRWCALGTKGVGAARPSAHMCSPGCSRCLLGMVRMSKTSGLEGPGRLRP